MFLQLLASVFLMLMMTSCTLDLKGNLHNNDVGEDFDITTDDLIDINAENSDVQCTSHGQCDDENPCNGQEYCGIDGFCIHGTPLPDGNECFADPRSICISGRCQVSICGDGVVDESNGEQCDDGNLLPGDGCENDCTLTNECTLDSQCNDDHDCTNDRCDPDFHICVHFNRAADFLCRSSTGQCDLEEYCNGISSDCPTDQFGLAGTACNDGNYCTYPDQCDGDNNCLGVTANELHDVESISTGGFHSCAIITGGLVKCWGCNNAGQLGDGTTTSTSFPVTVTGLSASATSISCGYAHTCAILDTGALVCWGSNGYGQLGNGSTISSLTPIEVPMLSSGVANVSSGYYFTCSQQISGSVKCWGNNTHGELGDGTTIDKSVPTDLMGLASGVAEISSGGYHACARLTSGGIRCWGYNGAGELGDNTTISKQSPVDVTGLLSGVSSISSGAYHTCALLTSGGVKCWGYNESGQIGNGTTINSSTPIDVSGLSLGVIAIDSGDAHTCALRSIGGIKCWGSNIYGQLGDGTRISKTTPVDVLGISSQALSISAGGYNGSTLLGAHTCALLSDQGIRCWGYNFHGQLGDGTNTDSETAIDVKCE